MKKESKISVDDDLEIIEEKIQLLQSFCGDPLINNDFKDSIISVISRMKAIDNLFDTQIKLIVEETISIFKVSFNNCYLYDQIMKVLSSLFDPQALERPKKKCKFEHADTENKYPADKEDIKSIVEDNIKEIDKFLIEHKISINVTETLENLKSSIIQAEDYIALIHSYYLAKSSLDMEDRQRELLGSNLLVLNHLEKNIKEIFCFACNFSSRAFVKTSDEFLTLINVEFLEALLNFENITVDGETGFGMFVDECYHFIVKTRLVCFEDYIKKYVEEGWDKNLKQVLNYFDANSQVLLNVCVKLHSRYSQMPSENPLKLNEFNIYLNWEIAKIKLLLTELSNNNYQSIYFLTFDFCSHYNISIPANRIKNKSSDFYIYKFPTKIFIEKYRKKDHTDFWEDYNELIKNFTKICAETSDELHINKFITDYVEEYNSLLIEVRQLIKDFKEDSKTENLENSRELNHIFNGFFMLERFLHFSTYIEYILKIFVKNVERTKIIQIKAELLQEFSNSRSLFGYQSYIQKKNPECRFKEFLKKDLDIYDCEEDQQIEDSKDIIIKYCQKKISSDDIYDKMFSIESKQLPAFCKQIQTDGISYLKGLSDKSNENGMTLSKLKRIKKRNTRLKKLILLINNYYQKHTESFDMFEMSLHSLLQKCEKLSTELAVKLNKLEKSIIPRQNLFYLLSSSNSSNSSSSSSSPSISTKSFSSSS